MSSATYARLLAELEKLEELYDLAVATYEKLLQQDKISYRFDSGEGSQQARRVKMSEVSQEIEWISSRADNIRARLNGRRVVNMNLRRKIGLNRYIRT
jgi:hypothetical protein